MTESHPSRLGHPRTSVTQPSAPPIYQTTAFDVPDLDVLQAIYSGEVVGNIYTRDSNPNHSALAESIAAMEHTEAGAVFASGMGALGATMLALCSAGDQILLARSLYGKTVQLAVRMQQKFGIAITWFDASRPETIKPLLTDKTRLCLVETVSNPLVEVSDIAAIAVELGSVPLVVDSTFTTPELIRPCELGASITIHSASKYLNGHGDLMLGVAAGSRLMMKRLNETASIFGQNANPFECWLCQRGLRTLPLRMAHICRSTTLLAEAVAQHPAVRRVFHPLLADHPSHQLAKRLYPNGTGGIFSMELNGDGLEIVNRFMSAASTIPFSPTLADARTTMSHPAMTSHKFMSADDRSAMGIRDSLVRISVGLEPVEQLRSELLAALDSLK